MKINSLSWSFVQSHQSSQSFIAEEWYTRSSIQIDRIYLEFNIIFCFATDKISILSEDYLNSEIKACDKESLI